jgi:hypothetical protein
LWKTLVSRSSRKPLTLHAWLIVYCFTSRWRIGDVTIAGEGLQNLGLCSALRAFEQGGIFIVPHLLWHGTSVFPVSSEGPPHSVASYDTRGKWRIYSNLDPHGVTLHAWKFLFNKTLSSWRGCTFVLHVKWTLIELLPLQLYKCYVKI